MTRLQRGYLPVLNLALRRPLISAAAAVVIFVATVASTTLLKTDFLESFADKTTLLIDQELPLGTRLSATSEAAEQVEQILAASPGVKEYLTTVGQGGTNRASMFVSLTGEDAYDATLAELEAAFAELTDAGEIKVGSINTGTSNDLTVTVTGDDPEDLRATAERVETTLSTTPGLVDVTSDLSASGRCCGSTSTSARPPRWASPRPRSARRSPTRCAAPRSAPSCWRARAATSWSARRTRTRPARNRSPRWSCRSASCSSSRPSTGPPTGWRRSGTR